MSLSSNSPCIALTDHGMDLIYTEATPGMITGRSTAGPKDTFDHRMKHLKVRTKHRTMKKKPYSIPTTPQHVPRGASLLDDDLTQEDSNPTLPTVLYYSDPLSTVTDVLKTDGRFRDDCRLSASYDDDHNVDATDVAISGESPICQWQHNQLCVVGTTTPPPDEDHMFTYPYECTVCREESSIATFTGPTHAMLLLCVKRWFAGKRDSGESDPKFTTLPMIHVVGSENVVSVFKSDPMFLKP
ncbi:prostaglandin E receptor 4 [Sarotherodon galilaeus]